MAGWRLVLILCKKIEVCRVKIIFNFFTNNIYVILNESIRENLFRFFNHLHILTISSLWPSSRFNKSKRKVSIMNNSTANRTNNCYLCRKSLQTLKACNYRDSSELNRWLIFAQRFCGWLSNPIQSQIQLRVK